MSNGIHRMRPQTLWQQMDHAFHFHFTPGRAIVDRFDVSCQS
jgi:hypothetical protein